MGNDPSNQPTPPQSPIQPSAQPMWSGPQRNRPPFNQPPWVWVLIAVVSTVVIVALLLGLLLLLHTGTPSSTSGTIPSTVGATSTQATGAGAGTGTPSPSTSATATTQTTTQPTPAPKPTATATTPPQPATVHFVYNQATVSTGTPVAVSCPSGEVALSGGWATSGTTTVYNSSRNGNGWRVFPLGSSVLTNAYVMCLQNRPSASVTERFAAVNVNGSSIANVTVPCDAGEVAVGGGFATPASTTVEIYNFTATSSGWGGYATNHSSSTQPVTFYAECLTASGAHVTDTSFSSTNIAAGASAGTQASCPAGTLLSGGAFVDDATAVVYNFSSNSNSTWETYLVNQNVSSSVLEVDAVCLSLG